MCHTAEGEYVMRIAVLGGTGLIGSRVVRDLDAAGHQAVPHSLSTGVDVLSGQGLDEALDGADVVVNLTNSPTFDEASPAFFRTSMDNLLAAADKGGVGHAVILSIVGVDRVPALDYYRAKVLQEDILKAGPIPYSIVRATQFMEFMDAVLSWTADADTVRLPATPIQPIAAEDVAAAVAEVAAGAPLNGVRNIGGPEILPSTSWAASPSPTGATPAPWSPTPPPACSRPSRETSSPTPTPTSPPPATPTGWPDRSHRGTGSAPVPRVSSPRVPYQSRIMTVASSWSFPGMPPAPRRSGRARPPGDAGCGCRGSARAGRRPRHRGPACRR